MSHIVKVEEIEVNGVVYIVETYSNGSVVKYRKSEQTEIESIADPQPTQLDRIEAAILQSKQEIIDEYTLELLETGAL